MSVLASTFDTTEPLLSEVLKEVRSGKVQLPDFQRGWVWDDDHIRALVASVTLAYPIGAVMTLQTGGSGSRFLPRLFQGVEIDPAPAPRALVLDGQQRLTSLFLALVSGRPVPTKTEKKEEIERLYFLDMAKCLDANEDRIDAVVSVPATRKVTSDFGRKVDLDVSTQKQEFALGLFPLSLVFDPTGAAKWESQYRAHYSHDPARSEFLDRFRMEVWLPLQQYKLPVIELKQETPKEAVCQVFERVNTGGVQLSVFELMTATFAAEDFRLRDDWDAREERLGKYAVLKAVDATAFLTAVTLLSTYRRAAAGGAATTCKRKDVLRLTLEEYRRDSGAIEKGLLDAARLLDREKVFDERSLPYATQLIPLSAICASLGTRFDQEPVRDRIAKWYWSGVFGELYGGANESRYANDVTNVLAWIDGGDEPRTVRDSSFVPTRLLGMQTRQSAAYKGLMALLLQRGSLDFISGDTIERASYFDLAIDIHHLFPRDYCETARLPREKWNSVVNKAALSARTNRIIGGSAPSAYLKQVENRHSLTTTRLDEIVASHAVDPTLLRADRFDEFIRVRAASLLGLIEAATGKPVQGRDSEETVVAFGGALGERR